MPWTQYISPNSSSRGCFSWEGKFNAVWQDPESCHSQSWSASETPLMLPVVNQNLSRLLCLDLWSGLQSQRCWSLVHQGRTNTSSTSRDDEGEEEPLPRTCWGLEATREWALTCWWGQNRRGEGQEQEVWETESLLNLSTLLPRSLSSTSRHSKTPSSYSPPSGGVFAWWHRSWHSLH